MQASRIYSLAAVIRLRLLPSSPVASSYFHVAETIKMIYRRQFPLVCAPGLRPLHIAFQLAT